MKSLLPIIFTLIYFQTITLSQPCLPEGITFYNQAQIDNFQSIYPDCTEIEGDVTISGPITNLNGLNVITAIQGDLSFGSICGTNLQNLNGLDALITIGGDLGIYYNWALTSLNGLEALTSIGGSLIIGALYLGSPAITNLNGLEGLTHIGGSLLLQAVQLSGLEGLDNVTFIGGNVSIVNQQSLIDLTGLNNLAYIGGDLDIAWNINMISLAGLENLITIGGNLGISDHNVLFSLQALDNVTSIGGSLWISNNFLLPSLSGLEKIDAESVTELHIYGNDHLSTCEVQSICDYLISPTGTIEIHDNAPGCNSPEEVTEACEAVSIDVLQFSDRLQIIPNPFSNFTTLHYELKRPAIVDINIYNQIGQVIMEFHQLDFQNGLIKVTWQANDLIPGIYFISLQTEKEIILKKVIKH